MRGSGGLRRIVNFNFGTYCENPLMMSVSGFIIAMTQSRLLKSLHVLVQNFWDSIRLTEFLKERVSFQECIKGKDPR